jgi:isoquinoline 1-oxidoreductase subunit beta
MQTNRRNFLALAGAGLTLALLPVGCAKEGAQAQGLAQTFLRIGTDNKVTVLAKHLEMGQGTWSGLASIVAEELDAAWEQMQVEGAPAKLPDYGNLAWGGTAQGTGGSTAIANSWDQLRAAGATAKAMLVAAAAKEWGVAAGEITVAKGVVSHTSGKSASFGDLAAAAASQPVPKDVPLKDPKSFTLIGKKIGRLDARAKADGTQIFGIDYKADGLKVAMVARSPRFGGKVKSFDASAAKAVKGVVDVVQIPRGVAVVADNTWAAKTGRDALKVVWDDSAAEMRSSDVLTALFKDLAAKDPGKPAITRGDVAKGVSTAAQVIEAEFSFPYLAHAPMEPMTAVCILSADSCEVIGGIQNHTGDQMVAAQAAGLKPEQVKLTTIHSGGSFGRRANPSADYIEEVVSIAKATGGKYPVKLVWLREDDITGGLYRPMAHHRITAALDAQGKISGWSQSVVTQSILIGTPFEAFVKDGMDPSAYEGSAVEQYDIANADLRWVNPKVGVPVLWWRSVGHTHMAFSKEVLMDELARMAGADPLAFRLAHLGKHPRHAAVLKAVAAAAGWGRKLPAGRGLGLAVHESFGSFVAQAAEVSVARDGSYTVEKVWCAVDCGLAINPDTVVAQMEGGLGYGLGAAMRDKITLKDGLVEQNNFDTYPVLRIEDMPAVEVQIVNSGNKPTGVGEPGTPPIAPAVANALAAATGKPIRSMPFSDLDLTAL